MTLDLTDDEAAAALAAHLRHAIENDLPLLRQGLGIKGVQECY